MVWRLALLGGDALAVLDDVARLALGGRDALAVLVDDLARLALGLGLLRDALAVLDDLARLAVGGGSAPLALPAGLACFFAAADLPAGGLVSWRVLASAVAVIAKTAKTSASTPTSGASTRPRGAKVCDLAARVGGMRVLSGPVEAGFGCACRAKPAYTALPFIVFRKPGASDKRAKITVKRHLTPTSGCRWWRYS
jgi:hypothetical protein